MIYWRVKERGVLIRWKRNGAVKRMCFEYTALRKYSGLIGWDAESVLKAERTVSTRLGFETSAHCSYTEVKLARCQLHFERERFCEG